ncbi:phosphotransferase [Thermoactinomyces mirandus]|uniref:Phosphotransferase n=1 Tax=Thermoactinomyces mirandus TaxID=2756294 RepID=A0A7W1XSA2_9BACL|nr:phosphotransferase [Thermoactinomyces mirandus]MBA4602222.1 phosphotransferase [Thermoactinomyces mirandus]
MDVDKVKEAIFKSIEENFDLKILSDQQIHCGWRNLKWKIETNEGSIFVKHYHPKRYPAEKLDRVREALRIQAYLAENGIPCPEPFIHEESHLIKTASNVYYCLTPYCEGELVKPGEVIVDQIYHLGKVIGQMHKKLQFLPTQPPEWKPNYEKIYEAWSRNWDRARLEKRSDRVLQAIESQRTIIDQLNLDIFHDCPAGWTHWDLFVDNLLFFPDRVSAILDFDRITIIYPELDLSRAILSCALRDNKIRFDAVSAFLKGYNEYLVFQGNELARSLKLLWCHESAKWIRPEMEERPGSAIRFAHEILWITDHWNELDEMFNSLP